MSRVPRRTTSDEIQREHGATRPIFQNFDADLRKYFKKWYPDEQIGDQSIKVSVQCYLGYAR
jgi:hypothetical protein